VKSAIALLLVATCLGSGTAQAAVYRVSIINYLHERIAGVSIVGNKGKVLDFKPTDAERFELKVDLPDDSVCNPIVRFRLGNSQRVTVRVPLCEGGETVLSWRYN
jgi:hypothetical protein